MLFGLSFIGINLSAILLYFNARKYTSSIYLGVFFLLISLYGFIQYVVLYSKSVILIAIVFTNVGFPTYLIGPMLYFYFRSVLSDDSRLKKHDLWHLLPMLFFLAGAFPYMLSPWLFKLEVAQNIIEKNIMLTQNGQPLVSMYQYVPVSVVFLSRPVLVMGYLLWSAGLMLRYKMHRMESMVLQQQHFMKKWLWILLGFLFILVLSHAIQLVETFAVMSIEIFKTLNLLQIFSGVGLTGLLLSPFFFPDILYGLPRFPQHSPAPVTPDEKPEDLPNESRKSKINLESDYLVFIQKKADSCMEEFQPYLQQDCNLAHFSKITNIPVHHLGYYFREIRKQPFNDFRNGWRVKHAKKLISEGKGNELSIEGIALLSGFATRNTFFTAFKKVEGISPGAYLAQFV